MTGGVATITVNYEGFKRSGFTGISKDGRMPIKQHPNIINKVSQRAS
jgi:hypothetical protein